MYIGAFRAFHLLTLKHLYCCFLDKSIIVTEMYISLCGVSEVYVNVFRLKCSKINPLIPKFLKWTLPSLCLDMSTDANKGFSLKPRTK